MKTWLRAVGVSGKFYLSLFFFQLFFYFVAPSFYVSGANFLNIPNFIKFTFLKYLGFLILSYLVWGLLVGVWNGFLLQFLGKKAAVSRRTRPIWALAFSQFLLFFLLVAFQYPAVLGSYPGLKSLSLFLSYLLLAVLILASGAYFWRKNPSWRAVAVLVVAWLSSAAMFPLLTRSAPLHLAKIPKAEHPHVMLLGFDALDGDSGHRVLEASLRDQGAAIFENAFTPLPLTHPAWNSILSGLYPKNHNVRYFFDSPYASNHPELYLSKLLKSQAGYQTLFASDQPETSHFDETQAFDETLTPIVGWKAHLVGTLFNHFVFPALWANQDAVKRHWGYTLNYATLFNYDLPRFLSDSFERLARRGSGAQFLALHTCFLHTPVHLQRSELARISGYWKLSPKDFSYRKWPKPGEPQENTPKDWINPYFARRDSLLEFLPKFIAALKESGNLQDSVVVFLSDHGERFVKDREIYGGVHGVDLQSREQSNVVLTFLSPAMDSLHKVEEPTSLIDLSPTVMSLLDLTEQGLPFDGAPLLNARGEVLPLSERPIWVESMGYIDDAGEQVKFPQISVKTLEQSLVYHEDGSVVIGKEYYDRVLGKKQVEDFSKLPGMLKRVVSRAF